MEDNNEIVEMTMADPVQTEVDAAMEVIDALRESEKETPFEIDMSTGYVDRIPYGDFIVDEIQSGRADKRDKAHADGQIASLKKEGQIEPVGYRRAEPGELFEDKYRGPVVALGGEPVLTSGFGRHLYIKTILESGETFPGGPEINALLWNVPSKHSAFIRGVHSNIKRKAYSHLELARIYYQLINPAKEDMERGVTPMTGAAVAQELGVTGGHISQHLSILGLPPVAQEWVHNNKITFRHATDLVALPKEKMLAEVDRLKASFKAGTEKVSSVAGRESVRKAAKAKPTAKELAAIKKAKEQAKKDAKAAKKAGKEVPEPIAEVEVPAKEFTRTRTMKDFKEWARKQQAAGDGTLQGVVFGVILDFAAGKIDERKATAKIYAACPDWKMVKGKKAEAA